ncbi:MAG: pre-peptidase C-terminal domain-containing protein, partial [Anaerolineae bacterium]|nr:pre-peptidase C-terminal domain-containing protein [Anaerolineae bacterium]
GSAVGDIIDGWQLSGLDGDADASLSSLDRPTLLNFWASWCPPCRLEFPHLVSVALAPDQHQFDVLFVNTADTPEDALAFLALFPPEIYTVLDKQDRLARRVYANTIPTSVLLDTDGTALAVHVGVITPTITDFLDAVAANPGAGAFVAADHANEAPAADLLPVDAASATAIQPGQRVLGTLTPDDFQHVYRFEGRTGDSVSVALKADSSELDAYLVLMAADGTRLAENDDDGMGSDSALTVTLPADGTYLVVATRFLEAEGFSFGDYSLSVTVSGAGQQAAQGFIQYGDTVMGRVSGNNPREFYSFEGRAGDVVTLQLLHEAGDVPLQIEVKDPHKHRLIVSEESVNGETALVDLVLPEDGSYLVTVMRERSRDTTNLDYTLTLTAQQPGTDAAPQAAEASFSLALGETVSGTLDDTNPEDRWTFTGHSGEAITAIMTRAIDEPGGLDGYLILQGPDGGTLAEVDDYGSDVMPRLDAFSLPADGEYTLVVTRFGFAEGFSEGEYALTLQDSGAQASAAPPASGTRWIDPARLPDDLRRVTYNERFGGTITAGDFDDWYLFRGGAGDVITVRMAAGQGELDSFLILMDGEGRELAINDDAPNAAPDAVIADITLPQTGAYLVRATRYGFANGPSEGDYALVIESDAPALWPGDEQEAASTLVYGQPASGTLTLDNVGDQYTFSAEAGARITISVRRTGGTLDPALSLRDPGQREIAFSRSWITPDEARISRLSLPEDGTYTLDVLLEDLNTAGDYTVLLLADAPDDPLPALVTPASDLDLELVLTWDSAADLDLDAASPGSTPAITRARDFCAGTDPAPSERLVWEQDSAAPGLYAITITYRFDCAASGQPVPFTLT